MPRLLMNLQRKSEAIPWLQGYTERELDGSISVYMYAEERSIIKLLMNKKKENTVLPVGLSLLDNFV